MPSPPITSSGDLDAGVDWPIVWIACPCGAGMARRVDADDRA
jgi:hypothetical protein